MQSIYRVLALVARNSSAAPMLTWAHSRGVALRLIQLGKPTKNAYVESFNGRFCDECLNEKWFASLAHARAVIEAWRQRGATEGGARRADTRSARKTLSREGRYIARRTLNAADSRRRGRDNAPLSRVATGPVAPT